MLGRVFIALCRVPVLKKALWRAWYQYLAASQRAPEWTFMNYGYVGPGSEALNLEEKDQEDRNWIQLYHHVAGGVDLQGLSVLEVGSGRGGGASFIKRYGNAARVTGVDLSANAVEFSAPDSTIRFQLQREASNARLSVLNEGPPLPADMQDSLFESMISVRNEQAQAEPHLGLGLYIVRLIAGFHGAHASARNLDDASGVEIRIDFPFANTQ